MPGVPDASNEKEESDNDEAESVKPYSDDKNGADDGLVIPGTFGAGLAFPDLGIGTGLNFLPKGFDFGLKLSPLDFGLSANWPSAMNLVPGVKIFGESVAASVLGLIGEKNANLFGSIALGNTFQGVLLPFIESMRALADGMRGVWPANLDGADFDIDQLKTLMMDEGLAIAWVPRSETIALISEAKTPAARRAIYGRRWRGIVTDCEVLTDRMNSVATSHYLRFLRAVVDSLRAGHSEAAQALAATTLDTAVKEFFNRNTYKEWIGAQSRIDPDELPVRRFFIFCQLWGIHRHFEVQNGDPIPGTFNRHGSVHAVSHRQYSRLNAVLALAHLTSLLWVIDSTYGGSDSIPRTDDAGSSE